MIKGRVTPNKITHIEQNPFDSNIWDILYKLNTDYVTYHLIMKFVSRIIKSSGCSFLVLVYLRWCIMIVFRLSLFTYITNICREKTYCLWIMGFNHKDTNCINKAYEINNIACERKDDGLTYRVSCEEMLILQKIIIAIFYD